jgi:hypothetical protein
MRRQDNVIVTPNIPSPKSAQHTSERQNKARDTGDLQISKQSIDVGLCRGHFIYLLAHERLASLMHRDIFAHALHSCVALEDAANKDMDVGAGAISSTHLRATHL